ncbi:unnamed protein product, partial [Durusdinium trenchii]
AHICNCGGDFGVQLPKATVLKREDVVPNSQEYRMMMYGGALYWHLATNISERRKEADPELLRGKDVLEVGCMRGGGARYLMEAAEPRRLLAVDNVQEHIESCRANFGEWPGLEYEVMDAHELSTSIPAASFDFVICIESFASFEHLDVFVAGCAHALRQGGRLLLADAIERRTNTKLLDALEDHGFELELSVDISRHVHAVGLCTIPKGLSYTHVVARKE